jgi:hypothetical protein
VLWPKIGRVGPTCEPGRPCNLPGSQVSSWHRLWALDTLSTASPGHVDKTFLEMSQHMAGRPARVMGPAGHTLVLLSPCFVPCHFLMSYCL